MGNNYPHFWGGGGGGGEGGRGLFIDADKSSNSFPFLFLRNLQLFSYYKYIFPTVVAISMAGTFLWTVFTMCALDLPAMNMIMQCSMIITLL